MKERNENEKVKFAEGKVMKIKLDNTDILNPFANEGNCSYLIQCG